MFKHYFERIAGIETFPVLSLIIFFLFFLGLLIWVIRADTGFIAEMKNVPLDSKETQRLKQ
jgi:cytochrome c oxidase cbb3-type subunit IV